MGIFIRLFTHFVEIAKECGQEKSNSNISLSSMDSRAFLNVEKMFKEIHDRYSKEILEWSKLDWPFDNTSLALRLKIEEYILVDPHFSLNLSKISLVSLPCELLNFDVALGYYRSMACNIKLQANSPLLCTNLRSIDISFNHISSACDPLQRLAKLQGLCFLNLAANPITLIPSSLLSSQRLIAVLGSGFPPIRYKSRRPPNAFRPDRDENHAPKSLFALCLESSVFYISAQKKLEQLPNKLRALIQSFRLCEVCSRPFIERAGLPGVQSRLDWRKIAFYAIHTEEYWIGNHPSVSQGLGDMECDRISLLRYFCADCFLVHAKDLTNQPQKPSCMCYTCPLKSSQSQLCFSITRSCKTYLSQLK
ncbi:hypothetical protein DSO57_1038499 [Entomophthora muscae]|nr:hypothetical protein DSO57_1038499 [Entomophthora muscae]